MTKFPANKNCLQTITEAYKVLFNRTPVNDAISWKSENLLSFFSWLLKRFIGIGSRFAVFHCVKCSLLSFSPFSCVSLSMSRCKQTIYYLQVTACRSIRCSNKCKYAIVEHKGEGIRERCWYWAGKSFFICIFSLVWAAEKFPKLWNFHVRCGLSWATKCFDSCERVRCWLKMLWLLRGFWSILKAS